MTDRTQVQRPGARAAAPFAIVLLLAAFLLLSGGGAPAAPPTAAIVDQLSLTSPNPAFAEEATAMLEGAGYAVDYYPGELVTVDFYRELPAHGYDLFLVRAHAGRRASADGLTADLFTSEDYSSTSHMEEQGQDTLMVGSYSEDARVEDALFTIPAEFVAARMQGDFYGATVILMGCDVLAGDRLAAAFVDRGAGAVVGWDQTVSAAHTDAATLSLLGHLLRNRPSVQDATAAAMADVGPDPYYGSKLVSYPPQEEAW